MDIGTLCKHEIVSVNTSTTVGEASRVMRNNHVGALLVTDARQPGHVVGILTDRDMVTKLLAQDGACHEQPIEPLCTRRLVALQATASLQEAVEAMLAGGVRRLLVQNPDGSIRGVVSVDDLFDAIARELEGMARIMRSGIAHEEARIRESFVGESMPQPQYLL